MGCSGGPHSHRGLRPRDSQAIGSRSGESAQLRHRCDFRPIGRDRPGNVAEVSAFTKLVQTVIDATTASLGEGGRLWAFGGAALLTVPGTRLMAVDLPRVPRVYEAHRTNLAALLRSRLDWSMLCPGPMIASENGKPTPNLRLAADEWPMARPTYTYVLPIRLALALAFKQKVPELTITYEDAAYMEQVLIPIACRSSGISTIQSRVRARGSVDFVPDRVTRALVSASVPDRRFWRPDG